MLRWGWQGTHCFEVPRKRERERERERKSEVVQTREQNAAQGTGDSQKKKRGWEEEEEEEEEEEAFENTQTHTHMLSLSPSFPPCLHFQPCATPALGIPLCASTPACEPWAAAPVLFHAQPSLVCIALVRQTREQHPCVRVCGCVFIFPFFFLSIENIACASVLHSHSYHGWAVHSLFGGLFSFSQRACFPEMVAVFLHGPNGPIPSPSLRLV